MINDIKEYLSLTSRAYINKNAKLCLSKCRDDIYKYDRPLVTVARRFLYPVQRDGKDFVDDLLVAKQIGRETLLHQRAERIRLARLAVNYFRAGTDSDYQTLDEGDPLRELFVNFDGEYIGIYQQVIRSMNEGAKENAVLPLPRPWPLYGEKMDDIICKAIDLGPLKSGKGVIYYPPDLRPILKCCCDEKGKLSIAFASFALMMVSYLAFHQNEGEPLTITKEIYQCWTGGSGSNYWKQFKESGIVTLEGDDTKGYLIKGLALRRANGEDPINLGLSDRLFDKSAVQTNNVFVFCDEGIETMETIKSLLRMHKSKYIETPKTVKKKKEISK